MGTVTMKNSFLLIKSILTNTMIIITFCLTMLTFPACKNRPDNSLQKYTIDQFMQIYSADGLKSGTNGFTIYRTWSRETGGVSQIFQWKPGVQKPKQLSFFKDGLDGYSLSPDGKYIVARVSKGGDEQSKLWLYNTELKQWKKLPAKAKARYLGIRWHRSGRYFFYSANEDNGRDFNIYVYSVKSHQKSKIIDLKGFNYVRDSNSEGNKLIIISYKGNEETRPSIYNRANKKLTPILWKEGEKHVFGNLFFSHDEKSIYLLTNLFSEYNTLAEYHIKSRKVIPRLQNLSKRWSMTDIDFDLKRELFSVSINEEGYKKVYITSSSDWQARAFKPLGDGRYKISRITKDKIYFGFSSGKKNAEVYFIPRNFEKATAVQVSHSSTQGIPLEQFNLPKLIHYKSFDNLKIPAFLYLPPNYQKGKAIPFIIHAHGGPESQFKPRFIRHFQYLLSRGYGIFAPNVRGSRGYGKKYMSLDNYKKRKDSVKDYYYGANWLIKQGYTRKSLLGIKGGSYGGYIVMALITDYPNLFSAAINSVGIVNFVTFLEKTRAYRVALREVEYGPRSDTAFLKSISPIHKVHLIKTPLLVVHGKNDPRVPVGEAYQIIEALKKQDQKVESLIFEDEGHGAKKLKNRLIYYRKVVEWFDTYLKDNAAGK